MKRVLLAIVASSLFSAQAALADTIELNNFWSGSGSATIIFDGTNYHDGSHASFTEGGGAGGFKTYDLTTDPSRLTSFQSWCVDIFHSFSFATSTTDALQTAASIFGTTKATDLGRLYTNQHSLIDSTGSSAANSAAFQLAIWEIVNEDAGALYNLNSGNLKVTTGSTGYGTAQTWLGELNNTPSASLYNVNIWAVQGDGAFGQGAQDVAVFTTAVPEPETYAMLLAGLGLMGFIGRRRRNKAA